MNQSSPQTNSSASPATEPSKIQPTTSNVPQSEADKKAAADKASKDANANSNPAVKA